MEASFPEPFAANNLATAIATAHGKNGYAVSNRFEVILQPPFWVGQLSDWRKVSLRCETVSLPGRNLDIMTDSNIYGPTREIVKGVTYAEDVSLSFVSSGGLEERVFFEEWQKLAFNEETWNVNYYNDYIGSVEIYLLDRQDTKKFGIKLWEAYPKSITATDLSQGSNNEIVKISVNFTFRYWTSLDGNRQPSTGHNSAPTGILPPSRKEREFNAAEARVDREFAEAERRAKDDW